MRAGSPGVTLLPMTDDRVETHVVVDDPEPSEAAGAAAAATRHAAADRAALPGVVDPLPGGAARRCRSPRSAPTTSRPAPGVLDAIAAADLVLIAPSNPVVSIGTILAVPGIAEALARDPGTGGRGVAGDRRRPGPRARRRLPGRDRRRMQRGGDRPALRRAVATAACWTAS